MESESDRKRARGEPTAEAASEPTAEPTSVEHSPLLAQPEDVRAYLMGWLDAKSLVRMQAVCGAFKEQLTRSQGNSTLSLLEKASRDSMLRKYSTRPSEAGRWKHYSWLQRKRIEETESEFDIERNKRNQLGFTFHEGPDARVQKLKLDGIGPRMLVSKDTIDTAGFLHWRLEVRGNNAVELGIVPEALQDNPKALHKCQMAPNHERPTGIFSSITVGSLLPLRVPLMKGSDIEVIAWPDKLEFLITQPSAGYEMTWQNSTTVPRAYTGPKQFKLEIDLDLRGPAKLALTCWAHAEFSLPGSGAPRDLNNYPGAIPPLGPQALQEVEGQQEALIQQQQEQQQQQQQQQLPYQQQQELHQQAQQLQQQAQQLQQQVQQQLQEHQQLQQELQLAQQQLHEEMQHPAELPQAGQLIQMQQAEQQLAAMQQAEQQLVVVDGIMAALGADAAAPF